MPDRKRVIINEIVEGYRNGKKDFSNIECKWADFSGLTFKNVSFKDSDLSYSSFENCVLTDCDFARANLEWSSFASARLIRVNFQGAKISWSKFNDAYFEKVNMRKANLDWTIAFNTNIMSQADLKDVDLSTFAKDISEVTEEGIRLAQLKSNKLKEKMPFDAWMSIKFSVNSTTDKFGVLLQDAKQQIGSYAKAIGGFFGIYKKPDIDKGEYVKQETPYKTDVHPEYRRKRTEQYEK